MRYRLIWAILLLCVAATCADAAVTAPRYEFQARRWNGTGWSWITSTNGNIRFYQTNHGTSTLADSANHKENAIYIGGTTGLNWWYFTPDSSGTYTAFEIGEGGTGGDSAIVGMGAIELKIHDNVITSITGETGYVTATTETTDPQTLDGVTLTLTPGSVSAGIDSTKLRGTGYATAGIAKKNIKTRTAGMDGQVLTVAGSNGMLDWRNVSGTGTVTSVSTIGGLKMSSDSATTKTTTPKIGVNMTTFDSRFVNAGEDDSIDPTMLQDDIISDEHFQSNDTPSDGEVPTWNTSSGMFDWTSKTSGTGDVSGIKDGLLMRVTLPDGPIPIVSVDTDSADMRYVQHDDGTGITLTNDMLIMGTSGAGVPARLYLGRVGSSPYPVPGEFKLGCTECDETYYYTVKAPLSGGENKTFVFPNNEASGPSLLVGGYSGAVAGESKWSSIPQVTQIKLGTSGDTRGSITLYGGSSITNTLSLLAPSTASVDNTITLPAQPPTNTGSPYHIMVGDLQGTNTRLFWSTATQSSVTIDPDGVRGSTQFDSIFDADPPLPAFPETYIYMLGDSIAPGDTTTVSRTALCLDTSLVVTQDEPNDVILRKGLTVNGVTDLSGTLYANYNVNVGSDLTVGGRAHLGDSVYVDGNITIDGSIVGTDLILSGENGLVTNTLHSTVSHFLADTVLGGTAEAVFDVSSYFNRMADFDSVSFAGALGSSGDVPVNQGGGHVHWAALAATDSASVANGSLSVADLKISGTLGSTKVLVGAGASGATWAQLDSTKIGAASITRKRLNAGAGGASQVLTWASGSGAGFGWSAIPTQYPLMSYITTTGSGVTCGSAVAGDQPFILGSDIEADSTGVLRFNGYKTYYTDLKPSKNTGQTGNVTFNLPINNVTANYVLSGYGSGGDLASKWISPDAFTVLGTTGSFTAGDATADTIFCKGTFSAADGNKLKLKNRGGTGVTTVTAPRITASVTAALQVSGKTTTDGTYGRSAIYVPGMTTSGGCHATPECDTAWLGLGSQYLASCGVKTDSVIVMLRDTGDPGPVNGNVFYSYWRE